MFVQLYLMWCNISIDIVMILINLGYLIFLNIFRIGKFNIDAYGGSLV